MTVYAQWEGKDYLSNFQNINECSRCGAKGGKIDIHYVDEDKENILPSNLEPLCVSCYELYHDQDIKKSFMAISKVFSIAAAHQLPYHRGKCKNWHGHEWEVTVEIRKRVDVETGMVMDFSDLKAMVKKHVIDILDHDMLNIYIFNPTAENLTEWIWNRLMFDALLKGIHRIIVKETSSSTCILEKADMLMAYRESMNNKIKEA